MNVRCCIVGFEVSQLVLSACGAAARPRSAGAAQTRLMRLPMPSRKNGYGSSGG
jgi:hypothetical protein